MYLFCYWFCISFAFNCFISKKVKKVICLVILLTPFIAKALTTSITVVFGANVKLHDKVAVTKVLNGEKITEYIQYSEKIEEPAATPKDGYEVLGWYKGDEKFDFSNGILDDTEITLKYGRLIRGIRLPSSSSVTELSNLGLTLELDLRESNSDSNKLAKYTRIEAQNYYVNPTSSDPTEVNYYNMTRNAVKYAMEEVVNGENIYFHCRIGIDRTVTVAYVLEGLLGVPEEERVRDFELSFFYGLIRIHRYHNEKPGSSVGTGKERFVYMHDFMPTNSDIYDWYMAGSTNTAYDNKLISDFKAAMIENN